MPRGGSKPGERRGGRKRGTPNKVGHDIRLLAESYGPEAIKALYEIGIDPKTRSKIEATRIAAIRELLDRGYDRAAQQLQHSGAIGEYDLTKLSDDEVETVATILERARPDKR